MSGLVVAGAVLAGCSNQAPSDPPASPVASESVSAAPSPSGPQTLGEAVQYVSDGVVRIETTGCDASEQWSGSGFLVADDLVATVAHVVEDARTISLRTTDAVIRGEVVGIDPDREVALVRAVKPLVGHVFEFSGESPEVTDEVAVIGFPAGRPLATTIGTVSALDRRIELEDMSLSGLIQTDAAVNGGNSGGPMVNERGEVVGLVEAKLSGGEGVAYAVTPGAAAALIAGWAASPVVEQLAECPDPTAEVVTIESRHADAPALARTFYAYVTGINEEFYDLSWSLLTGQLRGDYGDLARFVEEQSTTSIEDFVLEKAAMKDETSNTADVRFTSRQSTQFGPEGQTCTTWHLRYTMRMDSGYWLIDGAKHLDESPVDCSDPVTPEPTTPAATPEPTSSTLAETAA